MLIDNRVTSLYPSFSQHTIVAWQPQLFSCAVHRLPHTNTRSFSCLFLLCGFQLLVLKDNLYIYQHWEVTGRREMFP